QVSRAQTPASPDLLRRLEAIAALPGEPRFVSAGGVTRSERRLLTLESGSLFQGSRQHRMLIVAGLDGDERGTEAALGAVRWFKTTAPRSIRDEWIISALPMAVPDGSARGRPFQFPPDKGFFDHPEQPESRYVWRWVTFQAPDLVVEIRGGDALAPTPLP